VDKFERYQDVVLVDKLEELVQERNYLRERVDELEKAAEDAATTQAEAEEAARDASSSATTGASAELRARVEALTRENAQLGAAKKTLEFKHKSLTQNVAGMRSSAEMLTCDVQSHELRWARACRTRAIFEAGRESDRQRVEEAQDKAAALERDRARLMVRVQDLEIEVAEHVQANQDAAYRMEEPTGCVLSAEAGTQTVRAPAVSHVDVQTDPEEPEGASFASTAFVTAAPTAPTTPAAVIRRGDSKMSTDDFHAFIKLKEENRRLRVQLAETTGGKR